MSSPIGHSRAIARALACVLSFAAVALPAQKKKPARSATVAAAAPVPAVLTQRAKLEKIIHQKVLSNGLEVIVVENHGVPLATVEMDVRNGSFTQTHEYEGLAHMYEHMFFKSNKDYPEPEQFIDRAAELGAVFNGQTQEEVVSYYLTVPADSLVGGMRFLASAFRSPLFREDELATEREVVIGEYDRQESSPYFKLDEQMGHALYTTEWSRKNKIGDRDIVRTTTPEKMRIIQHRYYVPNNAALIVAGDVSPDSVFRRAQEIYGDIPRGEDPFVANPIPPIPPLTANNAVIVEQPVNTVAVIVQWQGPSVGKDPDATYAADVFSGILNQDGSAFQRRLVDSGLWHSILVNYYTLNHTGPITISGETTADKLRPALAALDEEIAKFDQPGYFSAAELGPQKQQRAVSTVLGLERASGFAHELGFWWSVAGLEYYMGYIDNMAKRTPADLRAYAHTYIVGKPHVTGVLLSPEDRKTLNLTKEELIQGERANVVGVQ
jgi:zinc protease